ncbi:unnamed protein product [Closterium sp. NIES-53]
MTLRPSSIPQRVVLPEPPASSLPHVLDPESDLARAASPTITRLLATVVTVPDFESTAAFSLVTELVDFEARSRLDYVASLVTEFESVCPLSIGGEPALSSDVLEDSAMDTEMASLKSTGIYVNEVRPLGANIVDGMWILIVKLPSVSPLTFKARSRDYEMHSLDFSTAFLQGSLHEEIWLRHPPGFTGLFPAGTQFAPSSADPSMFLRTETTLPPFCVLVYVDKLVFATADTEALALVKAELQERHTCTDLGELRSYLGLQITRDRARRTITLTQSHMVHQVLRRFGFHYSSPQPTPLSTGHSLSAPPSDESVEPIGPYPELVGCLMYLMTCTRPDLAYPLSLLARYVALDRHRKVHWDSAKRVLRYLCSTSGMGLVLGGQGSAVLTGHSDASWADDQETQRSSLGYTFSLGSESVSWRSTRSSSVLGSNCEVKIYAGAMAAEELRWLTYLLTNLGERPHSPPQRGQLRLSYVASRANTADVFTKVLGSGDLQRFCTALGLLPVLPHLLVADLGGRRLQEVVPEVGTDLVTSTSGIRLGWSADDCAGRRGAGRPGVTSTWTCTSGMGLVLGGRARVVLTGHADASCVVDLATQRSSQGYTFSLGSGSVSWRSSRSSSVLSSSCEAEIYAGAMAAQELRWLTYLRTDLGEAPHSPPVLYVDNKAMLALCQEHRLEHRTKHIALRYFLARELQQRGQLRLAYVASQANTADVFTKAL